MRKFIVGLAVFAALTPAVFYSDPIYAQSEEITVTRGGITLDNAWKRAIYSHAVEKLAHPAWGVTHSERDFVLAKTLALEEGLSIDDDVLFAAAFTHDIGAIAPFAQDGVDHAVRSVEFARPLLDQAGFPMAKFPAVERAILGHMFDKDAGEDATAIVLHDADALDFLGVIGLVRRIGVTGSAPSVAGGLSRVQSVREMAPKGLRTQAAKKRGEMRITALDAALSTLEQEALGVPF